MGICCGDTAENKQVIAASATANEDHRWSGKKIDADEGLNTVECLRGRLLAERHASRVAREEAESMGNKLVELEKKLREEIKLREKAERKLKFLKKKLESFNIFSVSGQSGHSDSSEKCENSRLSSSISSASLHSEVDETKHHTTNPALSENIVHNQNVSEASALIQSQNSSSTKKDFDSQIIDNSSYNLDLGPGYSFPQILCNDPNPSSEDLKNFENRISRSSSKSTAESSNSQVSDDCRSNPSPSHASPENICHNPNQSYEDLKNDESRLSNLSSKSSVTENEDDHGDFFDNSLAIVPVNFTATSQATGNPKSVNESVIEALHALRHARERLLSSMGTRHMIHVGPT